METDGSAYTLFPYPKREDPTKTRYSPFCGITGYRLFPRDKSMTPDSIGTRDMVAILVSKKELDWYGIQGSINKQVKTLPWPTKVRTAIPGAVARGVQYSASQKGNIQFTAKVGENDVVYCIVELDKQ